MYSAIKAGPKGHIIAIGRDMSTMAQLQQRLLSAEQAVEAEYQRLRNAETRFRMLLQSASDAIMIAEARTGKVVEYNAKAATLLGRSGKRMQGADLLDIFPRVTATRSAPRSKPCAMWAVPTTSCCSPMATASRRSSRSASSVRKTPSTFCSAWCRMWWAIPPWCSPRRSPRWSRSSAKCRMASSSPTPISTSSPPTPPSSTSCSWPRGTGPRHLAGTLARPPGRRPRHRCGTTPGARRDPQFPHHRARPIRHRR